MKIMGIGSTLATVMGWVMGGASLLIGGIIVGVVYWLWPKPSTHYYAPTVHERPTGFHAPLVQPQARQNQPQGPRLQMVSPYANVQRLMQESFSENTEMRNLVMAQLESRPNTRLGDHSRSSDLLEKARSSAARNDDRSAVQALSRAVQVDPTNIDAWETLVQIETRNVQYADAERAALSALAIYPRSSQLWIAASRMFDKEGRRDLATTALANSVLLSNDPSGAVKKLQADTQSLNREGLQEVVQAAMAKPSIKALLASDPGPSTQSGSHV